MKDYVRPGEALGESENFLEFQRLLARAARVDRPVLVIGERGSGKELAAARLHYLSKRWKAPFVALNCAALSPSLIESELFGYESGAFTGAAGTRKGRFEEAHGGTLFLDEIGLVPLEVQEKILRTVEYGTFQRVGSSKSITVDVRIVGATNRNLQRLCDEGQFKRDLLDRLSFEVLFLPPLRERKADIPLLVRHFSTGMARELGRDFTPVFSDSVLGEMLNYSWPGNIRELKNTVERAVYREDRPVVSAITFNPFQNPWARDEEGARGATAGRETAGDETAGQETAGRETAGQETAGRATQSRERAGRAPWPRNLRRTVDELEERWLTEALEQSGGHQGRAAELLGLSYNQFRGLYRKFQGRPRCRLSYPEQPLEQPPLEQPPQ